MDPFDNQLTTQPIQTGWEMFIEPYLNRRFRCIDNTDHLVANDWILTRTKTGSDGLQPVLTLWPTPCWFKHFPYFDVCYSSRYLWFHSHQIANHAHGFPKTLGSLVHWNCSWMDLKPADRCAPYLECGFSIQATQILWPPGSSVVPKSLSNTRWSYLS